MGESECCARGSKAALLSSFMHSWCVDCRPPGVRFLCWRSCASSTQSLTMRRVFTVMYRLDVQVLGSWRYSLQLLEYLTTVLCLLCTVRLHITVRIWCMCKVWLQYVNILTTVVDDVWVHWVMLPCSNRLNSFCFYTTKRFLLLNYDIILESNLETSSKFLTSCFFQVNGLLFSWCFTNIIKTY